MSGIVSIAIGLWLRVRRWRKNIEGADITNKAFLGVGFCCVLFAGYQTWEDQRKKVVQLSAELDALTIPKISGEIGSIIEGGKLPSPIVFTIAATLHNQGAPSILDHWRGELKFPDGKFISGYEIPPPDPGGVYILYFGKDKTTWRTLAEQDHLTGAMSHPIVQGGGLSGWIQFLFKVTRKQAADAIFVLTFRDVTGKQYTVERHIGAEVEVPKLNMPGIMRQLHP